MKINTENYEAYLLDLWEGTISEADKLMLQEFLEEHPELDEGETIDLTETVLTPEPEETFNKERIAFDSINEANYEFFFIAYFENDLSAKQKKEVEAFLIKYPALTKPFEQFRKAKLPKESFIYPHKKRLAGRSAPTIYMRNSWFIGIAAASIAILIFFNLPLQNSEQRYVKTNSEKLKYEQLDNRPQVIFATNERNKKRTELNNKLEVSRSQPIESIAAATKTVRQENQNSIPVKFKLTEEQSTSYALASVAEVKTEDLHKIVSALHTEKVESSEEIVTTEDNKEKKDIKSIPTLQELSIAFAQEKRKQVQDMLPSTTEAINSAFASNGRQVIEQEKRTNSELIAFNIGGLRIERIKGN
jgi:hypothetical protein